MLVIDEAGVLATRQVAELLRHTTAAGAKLVLTGDHRQLPELEAGGCFRGLAIRLPYIGLKDNRRQHAPWEQEALRELRHGDVEKALAEYKCQARIVVAPDARRLGERLVADWWTSGGPDGGIMIALRRTDVRTLNRLARIAMRQAGRLHGDEIAVGEQLMSARDVVVLRLNNPRRGVTNGDRGTVRPDRLLVEIGGRLVSLDDEYLSRSRTTAIRS